MSFILKTPALVAALLIACAPLAQAQSMTLPVGSSLTIESAGFVVSLDEGRANLALSDLLLNALKSANTTVTSVPPAVINGDDGTRVVDLPVRSLTGILNAEQGTFAALRVSTSGGLSLTAPPVPCRTKCGGGGNPGGSMTLSDLTVDFAAGAIRATVTGGNGVGVILDQEIWRYSDIDAQPAFTGAASGMNVNMTGLTITQAAFDIVAKSMGFTTSLGIPLLRQISDYGSVSLTLHGQITAVPEPSSLLLMGLGLAGLASATRKSRRTCH